MANHNPTPLPPGPGRPKGSVNKTTALLKDMILQALDEAGGVDYLRGQATANPGPFMTLVGKVLPTQLTGDPQNPVTVRQIITGVPRAGDP